MAEYVSTQKFEIIAVAVRVDVAVLAHGAGCLATLTSFKRIVFVDVSTTYYRLSNGFVRCGCAKDCPRKLRRFFCQMGGPLRPDGRATAARRAGHCGQMREQLL